MVRIVLLLTIAVALPASADSPPPFAFQWGVDYIPQQLSIDPYGNLWILDDSDVIHRTRRDGQPLGAAGSAYDVACTGDGNAFVLVHESAYPPSDLRFKLIKPDGVEICRGSGYGYPVSIALGLGDHVLVALPWGTNMGRILQYSLGCELELDLTMDVPYGPVDIAGTHDVLFVADRHGHGIGVFDASGTMLSTWSPGSGDFIPTAIATDSQGNLFVTTVSQVFKFSDTGELQYVFGARGFETGQFDGASGIAVNAVGDIYVADANNHRIQMFGTRLPADDPPPPPPPPLVSDKPPLTPHPNVVLLHIAALTRPPCFGPPSLESVITGVDMNAEVNQQDIVYLIASPDTSRMGDTICGVQVGISYDKSLEMLAWHSCSDLEFPGDTWPASLSGNTMTWSDNVETDVVVAGYFEVKAHGPSRMSVIPWPNTGQAKIADCRAAEYPLEVPRDRLGWVSWGHAGFGTDTDGCNPVLDPCGAEPVRAHSSTWGRLKNLYSH